MRGVLILAALLLGTGCTAPVVHAPDGLSWPSDQEANQLAAFYIKGSAELPRCRESAPVLALDSLGPLRAGQTLSELLQHCPEARPVWDWGDEGIPAPAVLVRFGNVLVSTLLSDTLPSSPVVEITTSDPAVQTREGLGPASALADLLHAYGSATLYEGECVIEVVFDAQPALIWRLRAPEGSLECSEIPALVERNNPDQLPAGTTVQQVRLVQATNPRP